MIDQVTLQIFMFQIILIAALPLLYITVIIALLSLSGVLPLVICHQGITLYSLHLALSVNPYDIHCKLWRRETRVLSNPGTPPPLYFPMDWRKAHVPDLPAMASLMTIPEAFEPLICKTEN